jgi:hypothetical protein
MHSFPPPERPVKTLYSSPNNTSFHPAQNDLIRRLKSLHDLKKQATTEDEKQNWDRAILNVARGLKRLEPRRRCAAPRQVRRAGTSRTPRSPQRARGGTPPPAGDPDPDPDGDLDSTRISTCPEVQS